MPQIHDAAANCDLFVFNGDIFDFQWSTHKGFEASVQAAEKWIAAMVSTNRQTRFVFLLGNHDCVAPYTQALDRLCARWPNLEWYRYGYHLGNRVFLHGDVCHGGSSNRSLEKYRLRCNRKLQHAYVLHLCYWALAHSGLPALFLRLVRRKPCARRILRYLDREAEPIRKDITEVYFGHVHTTFSDFLYKGVIFHNTGAAIRGLRLSLMFFTFDLQAAGRGW